MYALRGSSSSVPVTVQVQSSSTIDTIPVILV